MKPIAIEFSGLKSYVEKATIDFEKLLSNGLFGIFGRTGSGKSTVLDAIFLALYGKLPRGLSNADFINAEAGVCKVSFTFALKEKNYKKYTVEREYKLAGERKNAPQPKAVLYLVENETKRPIAENTEAVNKKIEETVGLKMEDFAKCIVLPQGQFAAFVSLRRKERLDMMSGLFNLEKYGSKLQRKVKEELDALTKKRDILSMRLLDFSDCTGDALKEKKRELELKKREFEEQNVKTKEIRDKTSDFKSFYDRHKEFCDKKNQLEELARKDEWIEKKKRALSKFDKAVSLKKFFEKKDGLEKTFDLLRKEKSSCGKRLQIAQSNYDSACECFLKLDETNKKIEELGVLRDKLNVLSSDAKKLKESERKINDFRAAYKKNDNEYSSAVKKVDASFAALASVKEKILDEKIDDRLEKTLESINVSAKIEYLLDEINFLSVLFESLPVGESKSLVGSRIEKLETERKTDSVIVDEDVFKTLKNILERKDALNSLLSSAEKAYEVAKTDADYKKQLLERTLAEGTELKGKIAEIKKAVDEVTGGADFDDFFAGVNFELEKTGKEIEKIKDNYAESKSLLEKAKADDKLIDEKINSVENELVSLSEEIERMLADFSSLDDALGIANSPLTDDIKKQVENYDSQKIFLKKRIDELYSSLFEKEDFSDEKMQEMTKILDVEENNLSQLDKDKNFLQKTYEKLSQKSKERCIIEVELNETKAKKDTADKLLDCIKSGKLVEFVAEEYLSSIAVDARETLSVLTGGTYSLTYDKEFFVVDYLRGGIKRRVDTVSGGELFLVSLSLALALSKSIYAKSMRPIEFFFLDEGFGSLDSALIDVVVDSLEKLKNSNFSIGVISHVEALKERITSKITVNSATSERGSTLSVEG